MNNLDMSQLMNLLTKVDRKDLEKAISQANQIMNSQDKNQIIDTLKKNLK